jgi:hypothetical protein
MTPDLRQAARRAIHVVTCDGQHYAAGWAILFVLEEIGWHPTLARLGQHRPCIWLIEVGYWVVARNRSFVGRFLFRAE